jgi:hypothetical protein
MQTDGATGYALLPTRTSTPRFDVPINMLPRTMKVPPNISAR